MLTAEEQKTLASVKSERIQVTGNLLSDLETRENVEDSTRDRLIYATEKCCSSNSSILNLINVLNFSCGWGIHTGYDIGEIRNESEQDFAVKELVHSFAMASASPLSSSSSSSLGKNTPSILSNTNDSVNNNSSKLRTKNSATLLPSSSVSGGVIVTKRDLHQQLILQQLQSHPQHIAGTINIPDVSSYTELLSTLMKERVPDDIQSRVRRTVEDQFFKPFFPEEFLSNDGNISHNNNIHHHNLPQDSSSVLQNLSKLILAVSNVIIAANATLDDDQAASTSSAKKKRFGASGMQNRASSIRVDIATCRRRKNEIDTQIRFLKNGGGGSESVADLHGGDDVSRSDVEIVKGNRNDDHEDDDVTGTAAALQQQMDKTLLVAGNEPLLAMKIEKLFDEELDICEGWFDAATKTASDFVMDTQRKSDDHGNSKNTTSLSGGGMTLSSAQLIRTKDEIVEATETLFRLRENKMEGIRELAADEEKLEILMEEKNEEDLQARVAHKKITTENQSKLEANFDEQGAAWKRILAEMDNITKLSAEASALLRTQVSVAEQEMERRQRFIEVHQARDAQNMAIEKLRANFKAAIRLIDTTSDYLGTGQSKITSAKVGGELSTGLRDSAAALHESYFEYASRLCDRIHNCEKRMAASALVHRNVDLTLMDLKSTKAIADDAGTSIRSLVTVRNHLLERLEWATEKLDKHLNLHKSIRDAESQNHSAERPVQQRVKDLEMMLREDVIRSLAGHVNQESIFLDVARSRLDVATKMAQVMRNNNNATQRQSIAVSKAGTRRGSTVFALDTNASQNINNNSSNNNDDDERNQENDFDEL